MAQVKHVSTMLSRARHDTSPMGPSGQSPRRQAERKVRMLALAFVHWVAPQGCRRSDAADRLGIRPSTLGRWDRRWDQARMPAAPLGRPHRRLTPVEYLEVREHVQALGPAAGLSPLRAMFPELPRSSLRDVQARYRGQWRQDHSIETEELIWTVPGTVWAGDFTDPSAPVDGCFRHILTTRDLPSDMSLLALPSCEEKARVVCPAFESLFRTHGAPLVCKLDNGGAFISKELEALLKNFSVALLLSPWYLPRYNGSAEAGNGSIKVRIFYEAVAHGRAQRPTSDDVAAAQAQLNSTSRPWGTSGPTPREVWQSRTPITPRQRADFQQCVDDFRQIVRRELHLDDDRPKRRVWAIADRAAIRRALETLGYLLVQRRRITPPFNSPLRDRIP